MLLKSIFSLLNTDYVQLNKSWDYKNVISPFYRLYYIDSGEGLLSNPDYSITLEKGFIYLIPSFTIVNQTCDAFLSQYYIHFVEESQDGSSLFSNNRKILKIKASDMDIECFKRILHINPGRGLRTSDNPKVYEKGAVIKSFRELNNHQPLATLAETQGIILQLLSRFLVPGHFHFPDTKKIPSRILDAIQYIETNLTKNITVLYLAHRANLGYDYFSRMFYHDTGIRPLAYIQQKRVERAQFLITTTDFPFTVIAAETGFESMSYFNRVFKKIAGKTPTEYKDTQKHFI
ncbi:helix-turn-helix domain-containing protein [Parasediminibacterium sp. JCM 36343]|uniref:helix-turn-helix domain-containing protein n=1 Tax=Parasediminibacterium sp. JCM 36343 TaxID=3374279 RepID=UPI00397A7ABE